MKVAPADLLFRCPATRVPEQTVRETAFIDVAGAPLPQADLDGVALWRTPNTDVWVTEQLVVAVSGKPRREVTNGAWGSSSEPICAAGICELWLREGPQCIKNLVSDFALVIQELREGTAYLAVDRLGLASLFWRRVGDYVWACTEQAPLVSLRPAPEPDDLALPDVFNLRFLSGSRSLWTGLRHVRPGTMVVLGQGGIRTTEVCSVLFEPACTASTVPGVAAGTLTRLEAGFAQRRDEGHREAAVLLSGGIDSTIMAALAARTFPNSIAYTARIEGFANPELARAREVARRLSIEHRVVEVSQADLGRLLPVVMARLQEPSRHFNNLVLARLFEALAGDVGLVVAGDAADLLFGGGELGTLRRLATKRRWIGILPRGAQRLAGRAMSGSGHGRVRSLGRTFQFEMDQLIQRFDVIPRSSRSNELLLPLVSQHGPSDELIAEHFRRGSGDFETFQHWHLRTFLTSIFRRNQRLSSPHGLKIWYPLLEPAILEMARRMPTELKIDPVTGSSKPVLRELCGSLAGEDVAGWSKLGFPSPERELMEGPLRAEWAACSDPTARIARWLDPARIRALDLSVDYQTAWTLLTLEHVWRQQLAPG